MRYLAGRSRSAALADFSPDVEFDATSRPDGRVWRGREGVAQAMLEWSQTWRHWQVEILDVIDLRDDRVLLLWRERGEGKGSGVTIGHEGGTLFTVSDGMITKVVVLLGRERALAAAGRSQPGK